MLQTRQCGDVTCVRMGECVRAHQCATSRVRWEQIHKEQARGNINAHIFAIGMLACETESPAMPRERRTRLDASSCTTEVAPWHRATTRSADMPHGIEQTSNRVNKRSLVMEPKIAAGQHITALLTAGSELPAAPGHWHDSAKVVAVHPSPQRHWHARQNPRSHDANGRHCHASENCCFMELSCTVRPRHLLPASLRSQGRHRQLGSPSSLVQVVSHCSSPSASAACAT